MLHKIKRLTKDKFLRDSAILTVAFLIFNIANFFYQFIAARWLGPESYAVVAALFSLIYIFSIASSAVQTSITKFTSRFYAKNEIGKIKFMKRRALKKLFIYSLAISAVFLVLSPLIAGFMHIEALSVMITGLIFLLIFVLPVNRGIMQGMQRFKVLGLSLISEGVFKLLLLVLFLYLGFGINGAILAGVLSVAIAFLMSFERIDRKERKFDTGEIYRYSYPVIFTMLSLTAMYSLDVILIKHLMSSIDAGLYSAISLLGKIVFFSATAISLVMFSKVSELHAKNKEHRSILKKALSLSAGIGILLMIVYSLFSKAIVTILFGENYLAISGLITPFALFMTFLAMTYILAMYNLSIGKTRFVYALALFNVLQVWGIYLFAYSLNSVVSFLGIFSVVVFLSLALFNKK